MGATQSRARFRHSTNFDGFIAGVLTGNSYDEDGRFLPRRFRGIRRAALLQQDADFWGFEAQAHLACLHAMGGMVGINAQADYVRAEFDGGGNVPRIPPFRDGGGLFFEREGRSEDQRALRNAGQDELADHETPTDGFTMLDASATFRLLRGPAATSDVALSASNLWTDRRATTCLHQGPRPAAGPHFPADAACRAVTEEKAN